MSDDVTQLLAFARMAADTWWRVFLWTGPAGLALAAGQLLYGRLWGDLRDEPLVKTLAWSLVAGGTFVFILPTLVSVAFFGRYFWVWLWPLLVAAILIAALWRR